MSSITTLTDYLITNSAARLGGVEDASVPGTFDPAYADHAIRFDEGQDAAIELPPVNDLWIHADVFFDTLDLTSTGDGQFWKLSIPNADIAMVDINNGIMTLDTASGGSLVPNQTGPQLTGIPDGQRFTLDAHVETGSGIAGNPDGLRVTLYIDGVILAQATGTASLVDDQPPLRFAFGGQEYLDGNARMFVSNVLVSDQDTRGRRFRILRPAGPGALSSAVGGFAELGDDDPATFAYAQSAGDAVTSTLAPGAAPPGTLGRLVLTTYARNAAETPNPSQIVNRLRIGGVNHDAPAQAPAGASIDSLVSEWTLNPATGQPWTWADLQTLEIGFEGQP
jgi:hypothetical protein